MSPTSPLRSTKQRVIAVLAAAALGLAGASLSMVAFGKSTVSAGPFRVQLASRFGKGMTDIAVPPLGRLRADTHLAPLRLSATLQDVNVPEVVRIVTESGLSSLVEQVEADIVREVRPYVLRVLGISAAAGLALGLLAFRRRWRLVAVSVLSALLAVGGSAAAAWGTYRPTAFLTPTFSGSLALAPRLIGPAATALDRIDQFRAELGRIIAGAVRVYGQIQASPPGLTDEIRVLHVTDIHLSPLGLSFAAQLAQAFDVDFVVDTGDLTSFGTPVEPFFGPAAVAEIGRLYVFVAGNHDSTALVEALERLQGVVVLDREARTIQGINVYGARHPVFTPDRSVIQDDELIEEMVRDAGLRVAVDVQSMERPPDIVAVHDDRMAEASAGLVPLVISGHFHETADRVVNGTLFKRLGSTGGAGAGVFTEEGGIPLEAQILYFQRGVPPTLIAYDLIQQSPETGSLTVRRVLVSEEFETLVPTPPTPTPAVTETPSPTPSGVRPQ